MDLGFFRRRKAKRTSKDLELLESQQFSEPVTIFLNRVKSIEKENYFPFSVKLELTPHTISCLKEAVDLNRSIVRSMTRKMDPHVGDIVCVIDDDPTDVYKQVLFALVKRGKI